MACLNPSSVRISCQSFTLDREASVIYYCQGPSFLNQITMRKDKFRQRNKSASFKEKKGLMNREFNESQIFAVEARCIGQRVRLSIKW